MTEIKEEFESGVIETFKQADPLERMFFAIALGPRYVQYVYDKYYTKGKAEFNNLLLLMLYRNGAFTTAINFANENNLCFDPAEMFRINCWAWDYETYCEFKRMHHIDLSDQISDIFGKLVQYRKFTIASDLLDTYKIDYYVLVSVLANVPQCAVNAEFLELAEKIKSKIRV